MIKATVISDASHCPRLKVGGWAAWVRVDNFRIPIKGYGVIKGNPSDATVAEIYAALNGVWLATQYGAQDILLQTDCLAVVNLVKMTAKSERIIRIWREAIDHAWYRKVKNLDARHVPGHREIHNAATFVQDWCDQHAGKAMRAARNGNNMFEVSP